MGQINLSIQAGWTASNIRTLEDRSQPPVNVGERPFEVLHMPYVGLECTYQRKQLQFSTGLSALALGSSGGAFMGDHDWQHHYLVVPFSLGYQWSLSKSLNIVVNGGIELGYLWAQPVLTIGTRTRHLGMANLTTGAALQWKCFKLGVRGHWSITDFNQLGSSHYQHTGVTTYLSYIFWEEQKATAKRLERQQAKNLR